MERDVQQRLCVAAERMGTGLLRTGAALERIATVMERRSPATDSCASASPDRTPTPAADSAHIGDYVTGGDKP